METVELMGGEDVEVTLYLLDREEVAHDIHVCTSIGKVGLILHLAAGDGRAMLHDELAQRLQGVVNARLRTARDVNCVGRDLHAIPLGVQRGIERKVDAVGALGVGAGSLQRYDGGYILDEALGRILKPLFDPNRRLVREAEDPLRGANRGGRRQNRVGRSRCAEREKQGNNNCHPTAQGVSHERVCLGYFFLPRRRALRA